MCIARCIACSTCSASPTHDCLICLSQTIKSAGTAAVKPSVKTFVEDHECSCPCSVTLCTRQGCHSEWLLATSENKQGALLRKEGHCVVESSCLSHENVQNLIIAGDGTPLPAEFVEVADALETWGGTHWTCWPQKSLKLMHAHMGEDNMCGGVGPAKMRLFHDCILSAAQWKAGHRFCTNSPEHNLVPSSWNTHFWVGCRKTHEFP